VDFKKPNMKYVMPMFILLILSGCSDKNQDIPGIGTVDLYNAFENKKEVYLSQFVEDPEYIPLELTQNSVLAGMTPPFIITEEYIIVRFRQVLIFDRNTGKFIKGVGIKGRGPDEYEFLAMENFYNEENDVFYAKNFGSSHLLIYNLEGKMTGRIKFPILPDPTNHTGRFKPNYQGYLDSATFAYAVSNYSQTEKKKLVIYTNDSIIRVFPNYLKWGDGVDLVTRTFTFGDVHFMKWDNNLYFKELFNDTLFKVTKEELLPRLIFDGGKYSFPYESQGAILDDIELMYDYFLIWDMDENSRHLFFQLGYNKKRYTGYYDKSSKTTQICEYSEETKKSGLTDDINNFLPVTPTNFTKNNEMVAFFNAEDIINWIDANPEKKEILSKKFTWLDTIDEMSNPVIFIAKCKD
jgi:hypothetical protein